MNIKVRAYSSGDTTDAIEIWNTVVQDGLAFPQLDCLDIEDGEAFFTEQTYTGIAYDDDTGETVGLYILHPNNIGRCGHISNASYAVRKDLRGNGIGEKLVLDCKEKAHEYGFKILQFNAVVATNYVALRLYQKLGFTRLGVIPKGFRLDDGTYADIIPHYCEV